MNVTMIGIPEIEVAFTPGGTGDMRRLKVTAVPRVGEMVFLKEWGGEVWEVTAVMHDYREDEPDAITVVLKRVWRPA